MRSYWVLFVLIMVLVILAGIGTTDLMWGSRPHVVEELKQASAYAPERQMDEAEQALGLSSQVEENTTTSIR